MKRFIAELVIVWIFCSCFSLGMSEEGLLKAKLAYDTNELLPHRIEIPPGGYQIVYYDKDAKEIKQMVEDSELNELPYKSIEAIISTPQWIRKSLTRNFIELYKVPIEAGKGAKIAFPDISGDGKGDLIVKSDNGVMRAFIAPYWKEDKNCNPKTSRFQEVVYHDVTGDGINDMVGVTEEGRIWFKKNYGTSNNPNYISYIDTHKTRFDIEAERMISPAFGDTNHDKVPDLIAGNKNGGIIIYYGPDYKKKESLPIKVKNCSKPVLYDIDKDGNPDLIVGCSDGRVYLFKGPKWEEDSMVFKDIKVCSHSAPSVCDINNDGEAEICVGSADGKLALFKKQENAYVLEQNAFKNLQCGDFVAPCFYDVNKDGKSDLIAGNLKGEINVFIAPDWMPDTTAFNFGGVEGFATPCFHDINDDGVSDLVIGSVSGKINYYENKNDEWLEQDSWNFIAMPGMFFVKDYYDNYYSEKEELLGMNDSETLLAYTELLIKADKKYVDEAAFAIAETPSEILRVMNRLKNADLVLENAKLIYKMAESLGYVKIVEEKDYTTLAYAVEKDVFKPIPRDIYYQWVVHPRLYWEIPARVDASYWAHDWGYYGVDEETWRRDTGKNKIYQQTKDAQFWRSFLAFDTRYGPSFVSRIKDAPTLMHAICRVSQFSHGGNPGGIVAYGRHSDDYQPLVIYMKAYGSCGENAIFCCACLRTALIPVAPVACMGEDHIWNEYWFDGNWYTFGGGIRIGLLGTPRSAGDDKRSIITRYWGNDSTDAVTELVSSIIPGAKKGYTDTSELNIRVVDSAGRGIDGAMVLVRSHKTPSKRIAHYDYTDPEGRITFKVGLGSKSYGVFVDVISPFGSGGISKFLPAEGKKSSYTITLDGTAKYYKNDKLIKYKENDKGLYKATLAFKVFSEYQYPENIATGIRNRTESESAKEFGYRGTRNFRYQNQQMNGIYAYFADKAAIKNLLVSGIMDTNNEVEREISGEISRSYDNIEDIAVVFFNKNALRTYVELDYDLNISSVNPQAPEITLGKYPVSGKIGESLVFSGKCSDDISVDGLMFSCNDGKDWLDITDALNRKTGGWQYEMKTSPMLPGSYNLKFRVKDSDNIFAETGTIGISLEPANKFHNVTIYQDNIKIPLPSKKSYMLGPFKIPKDEGFFDIITKSKEEFDMDMYLFMDKNGNRMLDGMEEDFERSATQTAAEYIFVAKPVTSAVYWLYLQGFAVPNRNNKLKINRDRILIMDYDKFKNLNQYAQLDLELSFTPEYALIYNLKPAGTLYDGDQVEIKGEVIDKNKCKKFSVKLDGIDISNLVSWKGNSFSYKASDLEISQSITHTVQAYVTAENGYEDTAEWSFTVKPKPDVIIHSELDGEKEWLNIKLDIKKDTCVEYIRYKIDKKGRWEDIPKDQRIFRKYVHRIHGNHELIVEYKTTNEQNTIVIPFSIEQEERSFGEQMEDIAFFPQDGDEVENSMATINIFFHKRLGEIKETEIFLDGEEIKPEFSPYSFGMVAIYIPEKPFKSGKHSVLVKIIGPDGQETEKFMEFEIKMP